MKKKNSKVNKISKKFSIVTKILSIIYLIMLLVFEFAMLMLDVLPTHILLVAMIVLAIFSVIIFVQLFFKNTKKKQKTFATVISILLITIFTIGTTYAIGTVTFLNKVTKNKNESAVEVTKKPFNVYISGMDNTGDIDEEARSDVNMIATVNPKTHKILLTSIPRDYQVTLQNGMIDKLTHTGLYGINETTSDVEDLLGIKINYYVKVNYSTLKDLVNQMGGITVNSDYDFVSYIGHYHFVKGKNKMDGGQALAFARERHAFTDGDVQRVKDQQLVMDAIVNKLTDSKTLLLKYNKILKYIQPTMNMSFSSVEVKALVKMQIKNGKGWDFESSTITGHDSSRTVYSSGDTAVYVMSPDQVSIDAATEKIKKAMGKDNTSDEDDSAA